MANFRLLAGTWLAILACASPLVWMPSAGVSQERVEAPGATEIVSVRTKKYVADYEFADHPDFNMGIVDQGTYEQFLSLSPEKQKTFFENRRRLLTKIATGLTNPAVADALFAAEKAKQGVTALRDRITGKDGGKDAAENSDGENQLPEKTDAATAPDQAATAATDDSSAGAETLADWLARTSFYGYGSGTWGAKAFPAEKRVMIQKFLVTLDQIFWRDAMSIASDQEPRFLMMFQGGTGALAGPKWFYFGGGPAFEFIVDKENRKIKGHLLAHLETRDPNPLLNANFDLEISAKFHAGWVTGKDYADGDTLHGRIWNIPGVAAVIYGDRFGVLFNTGLNLIPYSLLAAGGGGLFAAHIAHFGIFKGPIMAAGHLWGKFLPAWLTSTLGSALALASQGHSIQVKYTDHDLVSFDVNYGPKSVLGKVLTDMHVTGRSLKAGYDYVSSPLERMGEYMDERGRPICLNLNDF